MEMEKQQRWRATWRDQGGNLREALFYAPANRAIARIDFQLQLLAQGQPCPPVFELDEADLPLKLLHGSRVFTRGKDQD